MNVLMKACVKGFIKGAKETPRGYFAPLIALWRILIVSWNFLVATTDSLIKGDAKHA